MNLHIKIAIPATKASSISSMSAIVIVMKFDARLSMPAPYQDAIKS